MPEPDPDLLRVVNKVISGAIGRLMCPTRSIQTERADLGSPGRQTAFEAAQLSPARNDRLSQASRHRRAGHRSNNRWRTEEFSRYQ